MNNIQYDINCFLWSKENNSFYADAWDLYTYEHHRAFPNDKQEFRIVNTNTKGFRRFRFIKQTESHYLFESEDEIRCVICIEPGYYEKEREIPIYPPLYK